MRGLGLQGIEGVGGDRLGQQTILVEERSESKRA
jgi:hypothetical protein